MSEAKDMFDNVLSVGDYILYPMPAGRSSGMIVFCRIVKTSQKKNPYFHFDNIEFTPTLTVEKVLPSWNGIWKLSTPVMAHYPENSIRVDLSFFPEKIQELFLQ